ncbi:MAG: hypothetical protein AAGD92_11990 [Pseudomonadota bacterium]
MNISNTPSKVIAVLAISALCLAAYGIYNFSQTFFAGPCDESNDAVQGMRSLTQKQLADLHFRIGELYEQYGYAKLTSHSDPAIPEDLAYLDAWYIDLSSAPDKVLIVLDKCNVSVGISLFFRITNSRKRTIELRWNDLNPKGSYAESSQILWAD